VRRQFSWFLVVNRSSQIERLRPQCEILVRLIPDIYLNLTILLVRPRRGDDRIVSASPAATHLADTLASVLTKLVSTDEIPAASPVAAYRTTYLSYIFPWMTRLVFDTRHRACNILLALAFSKAGGHEALHGAAKAIFAEMCAVHSALTERRPARDELTAPGVPSPAAPAPPAAPSAPATAPGAGSSLGGPAAAAAHPAPVPDNSSFDSSLMVHKALQALFEMLSLLADPDTVLSSSMLDACIASSLPYFADFRPQALAKAHRTLVEQILLEVWRPPLAAEAAAPASVGPNAAAPSPSEAALSCPLAAPPAASSSTSALPPPSPSSSSSVAPSAPAPSSAPVIALARHLTLGLQGALPVLFRVLEHDVPPPSDEPPRRRSGSEGGGGYFYGGRSGGRQAPRPEPRLVVDESAVRTLMEMGFARDRCYFALRQAGSSSVELAMEWLLSHMDTPVPPAPPPPPESEEAAPTAAGVDDELARALAMSLEEDKNKKTPSDETTKTLGATREAPISVTAPPPPPKALSLREQLIANTTPTAVAVVMATIDEVCATHNGDLPLAPASAGGDGTGGWRLDPRSVYLNRPLDLLRLLAPLVNANSVVQFQREHPTPDDGTLVEAASGKPAGRPSGSQSSSPLAIAIARRLRLRILTLLDAFHAKAAAAEPPDPTLTTLLVIMHLLATEYGELRMHVAADTTFVRTLARLLGDARTFAGRRKQALVNHLARGHTKLPVRLFHEPEVSPPPDMDCSSQASPSLDDLVAGASRKCASALQVLCPALLLLALAVDAPAPGDAASPNYGALAHALIQAAGITSSSAESVPPSVPSAFQVLPPPAVDAAERQSLLRAALELLRTFIDGPVLAGPKVPDDELLSAEIQGGGATTSEPPEPASTLPPSSASLAQGGVPQAAGNHMPDAAAAATGVVRFVIDEHVLLSTASCLARDRLLDGPTLHALLALLGVLTRDPDDAAVFVADGGIPLVLRMPPATSLGVPTYEILWTTLLRHAIETPDSLRERMRFAIRTWFRTYHGGRELSISEFLAAMEPAVAREPNLFLQVVLSTCRLQRHGPTVVVSLKPEEASSSTSAAPAPSASPSSPAAAPPPPATSASSPTSSLPPPPPPPPPPSPPTVMAPTAEVDSSSPQFIGSPLGEALVILLTRLITQPAPTMGTVAASPEPPSPAALDIAPGANPFVGAHGDAPPSPAFAASTIEEVLDVLPAPRPLDRPISAWDAQKRLAMVVALSACLDSRQAETMEVLRRYVACHPSFSMVTFMVRDLLVQHLTGDHIALAMPVSALLFELCAPPGALRRSIVAEIVGHLGQLARLPASIINLTAESAGTSQVSPQPPSQPQPQPLPSVPVTVVTPAVASPHSLSSTASSFGNAVASPAPWILGGEDVLTTPRLALLAIAACVSMIKALLTHHPYESPVIPLLRETLVDEALACSVDIAQLLARAGPIVEILTRLLGLLTTGDSLAADVSTGILMVLDVFTRPTVITATRKVFIAPALAATVPSTSSAAGPSAAGGAGAPSAAAGTSSTAIPACLAATSSSSSMEPLTTAPAAAGTAAPSATVMAPPNTATATHHPANSSARQITPEALSPAPFPDESPRLPRPPVLSGPPPSSAGVLIAAAPVGPAPDLVSTPGASAMLEPSPAVIMIPQSTSLGEAAAREAAAASAATAAPGSTANVSSPPAGAPTDAAVAAPSSSSSAAAGGGATIASSPPSLDDEEAAADQRHLRSVRAGEDPVHQWASFDADADAASGESPSPSALGRPSPPPRSLRSTAQAIAMHEYLAGLALASAAGGPGGSAAGAGIGSRRLGSVVPGFAGMVAHASAAPELHPLSQMIRTQARRTDGSRRRAGGADSPRPFHMRPSPALSPSATIAGTLMRTVRTSTLPPLADMSPADEAELFGSLRTLTTTTSTSARSTAAAVAGPPVAGGTIPEPRAAAAPPSPTRAAASPPAASPAPTPSEAAAVASPSAAPVQRLLDDPTFATALRLAQQQAVGPGASSGPAIPASASAENACLAALLAPAIVAATQRHHHRSRTPPPPSQAPLPPAAVVGTLFPGGEVGEGGASSPSGGESSSPSTDASDTSASEGDDDGEEGGEEDEEALARGSAGQARVARRRETGGEGEGNPDEDEDEGADGGGEGRGAHDADPGAGLRRALRYLDIVLGGRGDVGESGRGELGGSDEADGDLIIDPRDVGDGEGAGDDDAGDAYDEDNDADDAGNEEPSAEEGESDENAGEDGGADSDVGDIQRRPWPGPGSDGGGAGAVVSGSRASEVSAASSDSSAGGAPASQSGGGAQQPSSSGGGAEGTSAPSASGATSTPAAPPSGAGGAGAGGDPPRRGGPPPAGEGGSPAGRRASGEARRRSRPCGGAHPDDANDDDDDNDDASNSSGSSDDGSPPTSGDEAQPVDAVPAGGEPMSMLRMAMMGSDDVPIGIGRFLQEATGSLGLAHGMEFEHLSVPDLERLLHGPHRPAGPRRRDLYGALPWEVCVPSFAFDGERGGWPTQREATRPTRCWCSCSPAW